MINFEKQNFDLESRHELMRRLINVALLQAIPVEAYNKMSQKEQDSLEHASVHVTNLQDYRIVMEELGILEEEIIDILEHENAHANKAEALGAYFEEYLLLLLDDGQGGIIPCPRMKLSYPNDWSEEKCLEVEKQVTCAPEEYGNRLSPGDIESLKRLRK
jgi:hypothetical protein